MYPVSSDRPETGRTPLSPGLEIGHLTIPDDRASPPVLPTRPTQNGGSDGDGLRTVLEEQESIVNGEDGAGEVEARTGPRTTQL